MNNTKILIVDDTPLHLESLEDGGFDVLTASDADTTMAVIRQHQPNIVAVDLGLGDRPYSRENGVELIHTIRRRQVSMSYRIALFAHSAIQPEPWALQRLLTEQVSYGLCNNIKRPNSSTLANSLLKTGMSIGLFLNGKNCGIWICI
jgi:CheY-like chemotaxis protein